LPAKKALAPEVRERFRRKS
jgi:hypothetical protein